MKAHLMIALSLLLAAIFAVRTADAVQAGEMGWNLLYLAGGFAFAGVLLALGLRQRKADKAGR